MLLTFVNNLSYPAVAVNIMNITGLNYRTNFRSYFFSFWRDFLFDIRHLCERDIYWYACSGIVVHYYIHEVYNMHIRVCESCTALNEQYCHIIQVSAHVQMDGSSLDTMMYVFMFNQ